LFEAETQRCTEIIKIAKCVSDKGQAGLFFLDEPMHSTPPLEGMSTCRAVIEHLSDMPGIRTITTTHYIEVTRIAKDLSDKFENVCMTALVANDGGFHFPYKIQSGASAQCIALELLHDHQLPKEVIVRAIELKNKLYPTVVNDQARPT
jgi:DNA mismatch repair ATPase MutS